MRPHEALRLQGVDEESLVFRMSPAQRFAAAGNCMSVSILCELLPCVLRSAGWFEHGGLVADEPGDKREGTYADDLGLERLSLNGGDPGVNRKPGSTDDLVPQGQHLDGDDSGDDRVPTGADDLVLENQNEVKDFVDTIWMGLADCDDWLHAFVNASDVGAPDVFERRRDVFPLPFVYIGGSESVLIIANLAVRGLNALYGVGTPSPSLRLIPCQTGALDNILQQSQWLTEAFEGCSGIFPGHDALDLLTSGATDDEGSRGGPRMQADSFDLLERSGLVDAQRFWHKNI